MKLEKFFIKPENSLLIIIDVQEKLAKAMKEEIVEKTLKNITTLIELCKLYHIPIVFTEQYPKGLGKTLDRIKTLINEEAIEKISFSSVGEKKFANKIREIGKNKIILTGMETHVCVLQTALDLLERDYHVFVPYDAVCSRKKQDWQSGLELMKQAGAVISCTETLTFQILKKAGTTEFKKILEFIK
ncbi:isochorismatase family protein [Thermodesulfovibrio yellowstonii]|uniref:Hydrolase n=1 Tax=Thermodesulfovibrio yellowstonii TaxID=28262 RepID=A0A9W6GHS7_9BACT|nr:isochorismatase family protein [Thermodesulfovibrio islandicus]GLI54021.1 hydrolase [Thermodesulfovibrio islandicus]